MRGIRRARERNATPEVRPPISRPCRSARRSRPSPLRQCPRWQFPVGCGLGEPSATSGHVLGRGQHQQAHSSAGDGQPGGHRRGSVLLGGRHAPRHAGLLIRAVSSNQHRLYSRNRPGSPAPRSDGRYRGAGQATDTGGLFLLPKHRPLSLRLFGGDSRTPRPGLARPGRGRVRIRYVCVMAVPTKRKPRAADLPAGVWPDALLEEVSDETKLAAGVARRLNHARGSMSHRAVEHTTGIPHYTISDVIRGRTCPTSTP